MDLGEKSCLSMTNEAVGMFLKTEVDSIAGAPPESVCTGATLENDSSKQCVDDWNGQVLL